MKLLTFRSPDGLRLGVRTKDGVIDLEAAGHALGARGASVDPAEFLAQGLDALPALRDFVNDVSRAANGATWLLAEDSLELGPCVPAPGKILCVGLNYRRHAAEAGMEPPKEPVLFSKFSNAVAASGEGIPLPPHALECDYEAELAIVMGRRVKYVDPGDALDHVLGYCNANDLSARDLQVRTSQWLLGKSLDRFLPLGPWLVTADEVPDPQALPIRCWLNGDLRQDSSTGDMVFTVAEIVSYASRYMTLEPGDVITTGTPEGVIFGREDKVWLTPGDDVVVEIGPLGRLGNRMVPDEEAS